MMKMCALMIIRKKDKAHVAYNSYVFGHFLIKRDLHIWLVMESKIVTTAFLDKQ